jgi:hypothetical protein
MIPTMWEMVATIATRLRCQIEADTSLVSATGIPRGSADIR